MDCKATVELGDYSRGGKTRGNNQAQDHDLGTKEKYIPCGIVDEDKGQLYISFGNSYKTSDFMVDSLSKWWDTLEEKEQKAIEIIQIKLDNGSENSGVRTQFLKRMVELADEIGKSFHLLYFPPYHSKYNPSERCWGILEQHWNGTLLTDINTMLGWAKSMTWKGEHPLIVLNEKEYKKGIKLTKKEMKELEKRLERNPNLPKWDILIPPNSS
jgi:transposase